MDQQEFDRSARFAGSHDDTRNVLRRQLPVLWDVLDEVDYMAFHLVFPPLIMIERIIIGAL